MTRLKRHNFRQREAILRKKRKIEVTQIRLSKQELNDIKCQRMLTDRHIDAAHQMLLNQFPDIRGLQSTLLGESLSFRVTEPPFIQILHVGGNHWMTVLVVDNNLVKVYDSMYRCISTCVSMQVASMLKSTSDHLHFRVENAQLQEGGVDCGLVLY